MLQYNNIQFKIGVWKQINSSTREFCQKSFNESFVCIQFKHFHLICVSEGEDQQGTLSIMFTFIVWIQLTMYILEVWGPLGPN